MTTPTSTFASPLVLADGAGPALAWLVPAMELFESVFHPMAFAAVTGLVLVVYEWHGRDGSLRALAARLGALGCIVAVGTLPALAYVLYSGTPLGRAFTDPPWQVDVASAVGVVLTAGLIWLVWTRLDWGRLLPGGAVVVLGTILPYAAVAPLWNVSGHVTFTTVLSLYLTVVDRRFAPTLLVPLVTVVNRPVLDAHTWLQSVAGLLLGLAAGSVIVAFVLDDQTVSVGRRRPRRGEV